MTTVVWRQVDKLNTNFTLADLGLYSSVSLYPVIIVLLFVVIPFPHMDGDPSEFQERSWDQEGRHRWLTPQLSYNLSPSCHQISDSLCATLQKRSIKKVFVWCVLKTRLNMNSYIWEIYSSKFFCHLSFHAVDQDWQKAHIHYGSTICKKKFYEHLTDQCPRIWTMQTQIWIHSICSHYRAAWPKSLDRRVCRLQRSIKTLVLHDKI